MSRKLGAYAGDLVDNPLRHLIFQTPMLIAGGFDGKRIGIGAGGVLAGRRQTGVHAGRDLHTERRIVGHQAAGAHLPLALLFFR